MEIIYVEILIVSLGKTNWNYKRKKLKKLLDLKGYDSEDFVELNIMREFVFHKIQPFLEFSEGYGSILVETLSKGKQ